MKILYFIDSMAAGGKERRLTALIRGLINTSGYTLELAVMDTDIHYKDILESGIKIHFLVRKGRKDPRIFREFYRLCRNIKPDIVHCWDSMTVVYAMFSCRLLGIPLINGMIVDTPVDRNITNRGWLRARFSFPLSSLIIGNSLAGLEAYHAPFRKSICVYNGFDLDRTERVHDPDEIRNMWFNNHEKTCHIIGMVAAFEDRKDYGTLIRAASWLVQQRKDLRFLLVGDGKNLNDCKSLAGKFLGREIVFTGRQRDVDSIINILDIGILLTNASVHGEGISNSILEYMAFAKPVIATNGGGTGEIVIDKENGFLIQPSDAQVLIERIVRLIEDDKLRKQMGVKGRELIRNKFDVRLMLKKYTEIYSSLVIQKL